MNILTYLSQVTTSTNSSFLISNYLGVNYNLFPQIGIEGSPNLITKTNLLKQTSLEIKWLDDHLVTRSIEPWKNTTVWYLACLLYNNIPIAILRNSSTNEDYFSKTLVINKNQYYYAASYLQTFIKEDPGPELEIYDVIGSFSGDINKHINGVNIHHYDLSSLEDQAYLNYILNYTIQFH